MNQDSLFLKQLSVYGGKRAAFALMKFISRHLSHISSLIDLQEHLQHCDKEELSCTFQIFLQDNCYSLTPQSFQRINAFILKRTLTKSTVEFTPVVFRDVLKEYRQLKQFKENPS